MTFDELANVALVGTARTAPPAADPGDDALAAALATASHGSAEDKLLGAAAVLCAYEACGATPTREESAIDRAPADERPVCSPRATDLLGQLLAMTNTPTKSQLVGEWLAAANAGGRRAPHGLLPALLEYGAGSRSVRDAIAGVADRRGAWLMAQNKRWQFAAAEDVDLDALWSTGNREQRASALRQRRAIDPAGARTLVESTWKEDGADERTAFVEAMRAGLSADDEPFLERALDDRSKQVRAAAAGLLATLPTSAYVERMLARAGPLLTFKPGEPGKLLRKAKPATLDVALPADKYEPEWARDNIAEKPEGRIGRRQWWLQQMVASVPPARWSTLWNTTPADAIAALSGDFADLVRDAWTTAAARTRDAAWAVPLLDAAATAEGKRPIPVGLLDALPPDPQGPALARLVASPKLDVGVLTQILDAGEFELPVDAARAVLERIDAHARREKYYDYQTAALLDRAAMRLPPDVAIDVAAKWEGGGWEPNRKPLDSFLQTLQLRRDIRREFSR